LVSQSDRHRQPDRQCCIAWYTVGEISKEEFEALAKEDRTIVQWFIDNGFLTSAALDKATIDDDQYNVVVCDVDSRPLYAIEYGPAY
jgi:hypothetical protein